MAIGYGALTRIHGTHSLGSISFEHHETRSKCIVLCRKVQEHSCCFYKSVEIISDHVDRDCEYACAGHGVS
jgi:hypothetical protein